MPKRDSKDLKEGNAIYERAMKSTKMIKKLKHFTNKTIMENS